MYADLSFKDGVLSAFEHHCAGSYNLPFTGFIKQNPMRKKFVNMNFERIS
jgi:hypothetical protein